MILWRNEITAAEYQCTAPLCRESHSLQFHAVPDAERTVADTETDVETLGSEIPCRPSADHSRVWQRLCSDSSSLPVQQWPLLSKQANVLTVSVKLISNMLTQAMLSHNYIICRWTSWKEATVNCRIFNITSNSSTTVHVKYHNSSTFIAWGISKY